MNAAGHKQLVSRFFELFTESDIDGVLSLLDDDVRWRMMGQQGGLPISGEMDKQGIKDLMISVKELMVGQLMMTTKAWTIDDNRVAVEVESLGELKNGKRYNNLYHYLIIVKDGRIETIKEYADTDQVRRVFFD
ncbi:nuclear transport factor 2 family protein [Shewanella sp. 10N.7]|uniref:Nuclear transport factor 2 family protein n=1 Tax=Shewanella electrodiphila TaxID=934143 RepID=A0ABT0KKX4_9GAMM|nr:MULTISPECIES: nuclear transport factor 2 family protein [Shewanella]MCC4832749.1 nuclear transport factor 2 family protein [Shewanella sp. 10N.7]MCL1044487.1 nuclear transport factor 2 family protein [Shewanella electrodiphila]